MDIQELSENFDMLWNNISSNQSPGLNEHEKSLFFTKAQYQMLISNFNPRTDGVGGGFDGSQKRQYDFSSLLDSVELKETTLIDTFTIDEDSSSASGDSVGPFTIRTKQAKTHLAVKFYDQHDESISASISANLGSKGLDTTVTTSGDTINLTLYLNVFGCPNDSETQQDWEHYYGSSVLCNSTIANIIKHEFTLFIDSCNYTGTEDTPYTMDGEDTGYIYCNEELDWVNATLKKFDDRSKVYQFPDDYFLSVNEIFQKTDTTHKVFTVIPIDYSEYSRLMLKPYKYPVKDAVWRLITIGKADDFAYTHTGDTDQGGETMPSTQVEIIGRNTDNCVYKLRYVKRPKPIILEDLTGTDLTIEGYKKAQGSSLPPSCHQELVELAVTLAKIAWQGGTLTQAQAASNRE